MTIERLAELRAQLARPRQQPTKGPVPLDPEKVVAMISQQSSTDGPTVGVMADHYLSEAQTSWAAPEVRRVINKLEASSLLVFADRFGMIAANISETPYTLVGPDRVPCRPQSNWKGTIDFKNMSVEYIIQQAQEVLTMTALPSAEAHTAARLYVVQTCDVLVLIAGKRGFRLWEDSTEIIILVDKNREETTRHARRNPNRDG